MLAQLGEVFTHCLHSDRAVSKRLNRFALETANQGSWGGIQLAFFVWLGDQQILFCSALNAAVAAAAMPRTMYRCGTTTTLSRTARRLLQARRTQAISRIYLIDAIANGMKRCETAVGTPDSGVYTAVCQHL